MKCLYLTHSTHNAVQLQKVVRSDSIRIHQAALSELSLLLHLTGARVIIVDIAFAGDQLPILLSGLSSLAPQCSLVVAAPEMHADRWEDAIFASAFDLILIPFHRDEAVSVLRGANAFAVEHLTEEACSRRVRKVLSLIEQQSGGESA